ncbi:MAG: M28 family peptidase [Saprospiraceae bacterium]|nr:M28 family peptidase [Saprospiraceae bacterium]
MKKTIFLLLITACLSRAQKIQGFGESNAKSQLEYEKQFDSYLNPVSQDTWMKFMSSRPHHVGSPHGKANADYMVNLFKSWGYQAQIEEFHVLFPTPKFRLVELLGTKPYRLKLEEVAFIEDKTSNQKSEQLPPYNAFSADGDVTAELVFVNRGVPADYEELEKMGISVKGKIVIARYGGSWRGIKPKVAYEHGAIGCLIYSDPADDGYTQGDVYPMGAFKPKEGVQRGSVMDMPVYPGDPLTPGIGATKEAKRLDRADAKTIMKIPVLPISYEDALPLLQALKGPVAPSSWRGTLPITYHVGPSLEKVHMNLQFNWDIKPCYNVIAKWPGTVYPDEWIIRGNHHDGWVNGAADPLSGMVAELDEAKALADLIKRGYKLKRTVVYCAWDAEEPSLLGSTEWAEYHADELKQKAVAYINTDGNGRGFIHAGGSHTLESFFNEIAETVMDPQTNVSIKERKYAKSMLDANQAERVKMAGNRHIKLSALGAGSDWSGFLQFLGIASMNISFDGEDGGGEYHTIYDSYDHFTRFKDPGFAYGVALSKTCGRIMMRLANADVLPFEFNQFQRTLNEYVGELKSLIDNVRTQTEVENKMLQDKVYILANDPKLKLNVPSEKVTVPYLDFSQLENAMILLRKQADEFNGLSKEAIVKSQDQQKAINKVLYQIERSLLSEDGLPRRPWYKHQIYAPGLYTGYGVKTMPGIREGIEQRSYEEAQSNIYKVANTLKTYSDELGKVVSMLKPRS